MPDSAELQLLMGKFIIGMLLFTRLLGLFISSPFFRSEAILPQMKIFLGVIIATSLTAAFGNQQPVIDYHLWNIVLLLFKELFTGIVIGFSANIVFFAARLAGGLIDFDMGYQTSMLFSQDETPTLIGEFYELIVLMMFLFLNGHHYLLESIYASIRAVPINTFEITESTIKLLLRMSTTVLIIGIKLAAPVLVALFLTNLSLALLARVAPQTNIFILSFQVKIAVGILVLFLTVPLMVMVSKNALQAMESETMRIILSLNPLRV